MTMESLINKGGTLVFDPVTSSLTADEFLSTYGDVVDTIAIVAKSEAGSTFFQSSTAPKDQRFGDVFSSFAQVASDIGIQVYTLMHGNVDAFFSRDPNFQMYRSGGSPVENFVCPHQENYWFYLSEIAAEIANKIPVSGIILTDIMYPRDNTCFCENCKREFSQETDLDRDFSIDTLRKRQELYAKWQRKRIEHIQSMINSIVRRVHQERKLEIITEILVDPQTNFFKGAQEHFGQDLSSLLQVSPHILLHFYPWSPFPSSEAEINQLIGNMRSVMDRMSDTKNSLLLWKPTEANMELALKLKSALRSEHLFFTEEHPLSYYDRRTLHLQLGV